MCFSADGYLLIGPVRSLMHWLMHVESPLPPQTANSVNRQQTVSTDNKQFQQRTNSGQQSRWSCGALLCYGLCARTTTSRCEISHEALLMYQNKHKILKTVVLIVRYYYSSRVNNFQHLCRLTRPGCNTLHLFSEASTQEQEVWKCDVLLHWEGVRFSKSWMQ